MDAFAILDELGLTGAAFAVPVSGGAGVGFHADELVIPASVMKIQIAIAVENAIAEGSLDGSTRRVLSADRRTPGPTGISLMRDDVSMSIRDLVVAMLTISDNVATDELIAAAGLDQINRTTRGLALVATVITGGVQEMLDGIGRELGFSDFAALAAHDDATGPPSADEIQCRLPATTAFDPARGTRTTASETASLLQAIWTDRAGPPRACAAVRGAMARQLTRQRIAAGFAPPVTVAAKSGGLLGVVRNEAGVVEFPDGGAYAVAVFTRNEARVTTDPAVIDAAIARVARALVEQLRSACR